MFSRCTTSDGVVPTEVTASNVALSDESLFDEMHDLLVAWHEINWAKAARDYERRLLGAFAEQHGGRRPFANLTG